MAKPAITLRSVKGSVLTHNEMDNNFANLANAYITLTASGTTSNIDLNSGFTVANTATIYTTLVGTTLSLAANLSIAPSIGDITPNNGKFASITSVGNIEVGGNYIKNALFENVREKVTDLGNLTGTVTINADNGSIQTGNVVANITINTNNLTNFSVGETVSLVLAQATNANSRILTSNILFAGGTKTLSTANAAIDSVHITYDGTRYLAALVKGYA